MKVECEVCQNIISEDNIICCFDCSDCVCDKCSLQVYIWRCDEEDPAHSCESCKVRLVCDKHPEYKQLKEIKT